MLNVTGQLVTYVSLLPCALLLHLFSSFLYNYPLYVAMYNITRHFLLISLCQESEYFKTFTTACFKLPYINLSSKETHFIWLHVHYFAICVYFSLVPKQHVMQPGANDMGIDWCMHLWQHLKAKCIVIHEYKKE